MPAAPAAVVLALLALLLLPRAMLDAQAPSTLVGYTVRDRAIVATSIGAGPAEVILIGGLHAGSESNTVALADQLLAYFSARPHELPAEVTLTIVPAVNLDGLVAGTRANANGVDLNRNWPTDDWAPFALHGEEIVSGGAGPGSEPEVASLHNFLLQRDPALVVSFHSVALVVQSNGVGLAAGYAMAYAADDGYQFIPDWPFYPITGEQNVA
ncbi:MAG: M14 family zinc carboxypeptidase, partial [Dehalococcoidia bacterium]